jgi:hypothetical protein
LPPALRWTRWILICLAGLQLVVALLFVGHRPEVVASWILSHPEFSAEQLDNAVRQTIVGSVAVHLAAAALYGWLAWAMPWGHRWIRRLTTATLIIGSVAGYLFLRNSSALIPSGVAGVTTEQVLSLLLRIAALCLIWIPREARVFISSSPASD